MQRARNAGIALLIAVVLGPAVVSAQQHVGGTPGQPSAKASATPKRTHKTHTAPTAPQSASNTPAAPRVPVANRPQRHENIERHREIQERRIERAGVREDVRGIHDINRGAALIREGQKIGGKEGAKLERRGKAMEKIGERDVKQGNAMVNRGKAEMTPIPVRTTPPQPEPITKHSDFVWDHRPAPSPEVDDRGVHIDAKPVNHAPDAREILDNPKWADTFKRLEKEELTADNHHWHYEPGMQYSHYMDHYGDHWFGIYHDSSYYWVRHHEGRYWWHDDGKNQWNYWHDGSWWSQDPHSSKATAVSSGSNEQAGGGPSSTSYATPPVTMAPTQGPANMNQTESQPSSDNSNDSDASDSSGSAPSQTEPAAASN